MVENLQDALLGSTPAFPGLQPSVVIPSILKDHPQVKQITTQANGMTLRQYYLGQVLTGVAGISGIQNKSEMDFERLVASLIRVVDAALAAESK